MYLNLLVVIAFFANGLWMDGPMDPQSEKASYRDAWTHLNSGKGTETAGKERKQLRSKEEWWKGRKRGGKVGIKVER